MAIPKDTARLLLSVLLAAAACNASNASGTYVAHAPTFTEMLQLTETGSGQITGVLSTVQLKKDGQIDPEQLQVTGTVGAGQIVLTFHSLIIFSSTLAGTLSNNGLQLQQVDSDGNVSTESFARSTPTQFKTYADELKSRGAGIVLTNKLLSNAEQLRATVRNAESWIANAEMHAARIPAAKAQYDTIEDQMRALVAQERGTSNPAARSQISVAVVQGDIAGGQVDIQLQQIWDVDIVNSGSDFTKAFTEWDGNCGNRDQLQRRGATASAIEEWESACSQTLAEREKFMPVHKRITEQRVELQSFENTAQSHRKAIVHEANTIQ